jgi:hypothetical protein
MRGREQKLSTEVLAVLAEIQSDGPSAMAGRVV